MNDAMCRAIRHDHTRPLLKLVQGQNPAQPVMFDGLPFMDERARQDACDAVTRVLTVPGCESVAIYLRLWTARGEVSLSLTATAIGGGEHAGERSLAL